jgi:Uma2 family endonuclease
MPVAAELRMTADQFVAWAMRQPEGERYELVAGEVVAMAPERAGHSRAKSRIHRALADAVAAAGLPCEAFPDGMAVRIGDDTVYEPDALVRCGPLVDDETVEISDPVIVVEVVSPSSRSRDTALKLADYFRLDSLRHYLIARAGRGLLIHHRRAEDGGIETAILHGGELRLDPPGLVLDIGALFGELS